MKNDKFEATEELYSTWADEQLVKATTVDRNEYYPEAIDMMLKVLKKRGVSEQQFTAIQSDVEKQKDVDIKQSTDYRGFIISLIVFSIGKACASILPPIISTLLIGAAVGALVGMVPYLVGKKNGQLGLAQVAIFVTAIAGAGFGLVLAVPVSLVFIAAILIRKRQTNKEN